MDVFDQDQTRTRILENEVPGFWESIRVLLKEIAIKAESDARHVTIDESVGDCVIIQSQEGRCPDRFHPKIRTLKVRFNRRTRNITVEAVSSCPGVPERTPERFVFDAELSSGAVFAGLKEAKFTRPDEVANDILAKFFHLRPLSP